MKKEGVCGMDAATQRPHIVGRQDVWSRYWESGIICQIFLRNEPTIVGRSCRSNSDLRYDVHFSNGISRQSNKTPNRK